MFCYLQFLLKHKKWTTTTKKKLDLVFCEEIHVCGLIETAAICSTFSEHHRIHTFGRDV